MRKAVQILLLCCVLIPMAGIAREETLEDRKQRIMRKYLREANELSRVDWTVPDSSDDELVAESEKFQPTDLEYEKHEGAVIPPVMTRRTSIPNNGDNWTAAAAAEELSEDPYADPFALAQRDEADEDITGRTTRRERPGQRDDRSSSDLFSGSGNRYQSRLDTGRDYRTRQTYSANPLLQQNQFGSDEREGLIERRAPEDKYSSPLQSVRIYGSSPDEGLLLPAPTYRNVSGQEDRLKSGQIPFKYRRLTSESEEQSQGGQLPSSSYRRHTEPLPYQQLKSREKAWNPTADDAYVDELKYKVLQP